MGLVADDVAEVATDATDEEGADTESSDDADADEADADETGADEGADGDAADGETAGDAAADTESSDEAASDESREVRRLEHRHERVHEEDARQSGDEEELQRVPSVAGTGARQLHRCGVDAGWSRSRMNSHRNHRYASSEPLVRDLTVPTRRRFAGRPRCRRRP